MKNKLKSAFNSDVDEIINLRRLKDLPEEKPTKVTFSVIY